MNEHRDQDGFRGWVKWIVVIAALMTIANGVYDVIQGWKSYPAAQVEHRK